MLPTANISVNRNKIKTYGNCVYLKSGTNFEIELWNPRKTKVLASIEIDGKSISTSGIIINPGQRVYLERWIDEPRSFKFSTYEAEDSKEGKEATSNNGRVKVIFYDEVIKQFYPNGYWNGIVVPDNFPSPTPYWYYTNNVSTNNVSTNNVSTGGSNLSHTTGEMSFFSAEIKSFETGITEKGDSSSQKLQEGSGEFNSWASSNIEWKILPESAKPIDSAKLRSYCPECGIRVRATSWKFCPSCGEKF